MLHILAYRSALLHAGHKISRSHACPGSLKTSAGPRDIHSVFRSWIRLHPVKLENISEASPARRLLAKEPKYIGNFIEGMNHGLTSAIYSFEANFRRHPDSVTPSGKVKLVRYQENPTSHWGPGTKAGGKAKRKRGLEDG